MKTIANKQSRRVGKRGGVLFLFAIVILSAWWFISEKETTPPEHGVLDVWTTWGDTPDMLQEILQPYAQEHGIEVRVSSRVRLDDLTEVMTSGEVPDLVILSAADPIPLYFDLGLVEPLNEWSSSGGSALEAFFPSALDRCVTVDGELACLPWGCDVMALYWNRDLFSTAGLDPNAPPESVDALIEYARKLTLRDEDGQLMQVGFIPDLPAPHAELYAAAVSEETNESVAEQVEDQRDWLNQFDEPFGPEELEEFIDAFTPYTSSSHPVFSDRRMSCRQCHRTTDLSGKKIPALGLSAGKLAMMVEGSWEFGAIGMMDWATVGFAPFPASPGSSNPGGTISVDGPVVFIPSSAEDKAGALDLLGWIMQPGVQAEAARTFSLLPASADVADGGVFTLSEEFRPLLELLSGS